MKNGAGQPEEFKDEYGRTKYRVKGTDGWSLVTNDKKLAQAEARNPGAYSEGRICR